MFDKSNICRIIFDKMSDIFLTLNQVAEYYGVKKPSEFAKKTGLSHQSSSNYLKGERRPTVEALSKIQSVFEKINPDWLLTGNVAQY